MFYDGPVAKKSLHFDGDMLILEINGGEKWVLLDAWWHEFPILAQKEGKGGGSGWHG